MSEVGFRVKEEVGQTMDTQKKLSQSSFVFQSSLETCIYCGACIIDTGRSSSVVLYTRNGPTVVPQLEKRCKKKECQVGYWDGYHIYKGLLVYDEGAMANQHLIVSRNTAFEVL